MKTIILQLEDDVFQDLKSWVGISYMCSGSLDGEANQLCGLIIHAIEKGEKELHVVKKAAKAKMARKAKKRGGLMEVEK